MKKLFALLAVALIGTTAFAQEAKEAEKQDSGYHFTVIKENKRTREK